MWTSLGDRYSIESGSSSQSRVHASSDSSSRNKNNLGMNNNYIGDGALTVPATVPALPWVLTHMSSRQPQEGSLIFSRQDNRGYTADPSHSLSSPRIRTASSTPVLVHAHTLTHTPLLLSGWPEVSRKQRKKMSSPPASECKALCSSVPPGRTTPHGYPKGANFQECPHPEVTRYELGLSEQVWDHQAQGLEATVARLGETLGQND
jgi:hypothetical protein